MLIRIFFLGSIGKSQIVHFNAFKFSIERIRFFLSKIVF